MACVKTELINAIKADIGAIAAIKEVSLNPYVKPIDGNYLAIRPYTVIIDQPETASRANRYRRASFDLVITTLIYSDISDDLSPVMDDLQAQIYLKITSKDAAYRNYCPKCEEVSAEKTYINENEGALVQVFKLEYYHDHDDPYTINP